MALLAAAATAGLGAYAVMPERAQLLLPDWTLMTLGAIAMGCAILVPVATSFKQKGFARMNEVVITSQTKVQGDVTAADATRIAEQVQKAKP